MSVSSLVDEKLEEKILSIGWKHNRLLQIWTGMQLLRKYTFKCLPSYTVVIVCLYAVLFFKYSGSGFEGICISVYLVVMHLVSHIFLKCVLNKTTISSRKHSISVDLKLSPAPICAPLSEGHWKRWLKGSRNSIQPSACLPSRPCFFIALSFPVSDQL